MLICDFWILSKFHPENILINPLGIQRAFSIQIFLQLAMVLCPKLLCEFYQCPPLVLTSGDVTQMQAQLPATMKANTGEADADVKESGALADVRLQDGGLTSQSPSPPLRGGRGFDENERGTDKETKGGG